MSVHRGKPEIICSFRVFRRLTQNGLARILRRLRLEPKHFPYGRDHEHHFPDRGRAFHFDWNALKGVRDLGNAQPMRDLGRRK